jgi:hypothetical protein
VIHSVPRDQFPAVYPDVAKYFASFVERAHGGLLPGFLEGEVNAGRAHVLVAAVDDKIRACAVTSFAPNGDISLHYCAGEGRDDWQAEMLDAVERIADERGVSVEVTCRPGWVRSARMAERGYRETHRVMERRANG